MCIRDSATPDPRESGEFGITAEHKVGEGPTGKVGGSQPAAHVATCGAETSFQVELDGCAPVTGYAQDAAPGLGDWNVTCCGEHAVEQIGQSADRPVLGRTIVIGAGPIPIWDAAATEGDSIVSGALGIHVRVSCVSEQLSTFPPDLGHHRFR